MHPLPPILVHVVQYQQGEPAVHRLPLGLDHLQELGEDRLQVLQDLRWGWG